MEAPQQAVCLLTARDGGLGAAGWSLGDPFSEGECVVGEGVSSFLDLVGEVIPEFCHLCSLRWKEESPLFFLQRQCKSLHVTEVRTSYF